MESWSFPAIPTWLLLTFGVLFGVYKFCTWHFGIFKRLGIKGPSPIPVLGTMWPMVSQGLMTHDLGMKKKYGPIVGTFQGRTPILMIYDTEILKQILVKDFSNFTNRYDPGIQEYPVDKMVSLLRDGHWKHVRNQMSPTFSGGKLKKMNGKMLKCVETFLNNLEKKAESKEILELRECLSPTAAVISSTAAHSLLFKMAPLGWLTGAFTMDVIASTAFGLQIDSHNDPNNQFVQMGKKAFQFSFFKISTLIFFFFPFLMKPLGKLGFTVFPKDTVSFFLAAVDRAVKERRSNTGALDNDNVDFLQLMINAEADDEDNGKKANDEKNNSTTEMWTKKTGLSHDEVLAQCLMFFLAGYETTASTLALFGYELAVHPDVQDRLIKEIDEVLRGHDHVTYDLVQKMPYLDMCLSEILRLYPAGPRTDRVTKSDIVVNGLFIPKGMVIGVPIYALQNDPDVWTNPEKFDPDRFSPEARESQDQFHYFPFGVGPRNCVGMRLALMELKMSMVHVLQKLKFVVCEKTQIPLKLEKLRMQAIDGIHLRMEKREKSC